MFIFYGNRPNCDLLIHNGFVHPGSSSDAVRVRLGVARADPLYAEKVALLQKLGLPASGDWEICVGPQPISDKLRAFLRVFNMDKSKSSRPLRSLALTLPRNETIFMGRGSCIQGSHSDG